MENIELYALTALKDNYIWGYQRDGLGALLVDISEFTLLRDALEISPTITYIVAVLLTHAHKDHIAGVAAFHEACPLVPIYGPQECADVLPVPVHVVEAGETLQLEAYNVQVIGTPGHTAGSVSYYVDNVLFCGDTLFGGGCGRVFTGDYQAMFNSLQKIKALPPETKVCAAHEYTLANLNFASQVAKTQTEKEAIEANAGIAKYLLQQGEPILPSTLAVELEINPFLRAKTVEEFKALRELKDKF